jgi:acetoin utilization protein AcuB
MLIKNWMRPDVVAAGPDDSFRDAANLMKTHGIRMLPVMEKGRLAGIVTDRDLRSGPVSPGLPPEVHELIQRIGEIRVREIMKRDVITVPLDYTVEEAAEVLLTHRISGAPVVDKEGQVVGTITQSDLFTVLMSLTGMGKRGIEFAFMQKLGIQFALKVEDNPGAIRDLEDIIRKYGGRLRSILSSRQRVDAGYLKVYICMYGIARSKLPQLKKELQERASLLYVVDHKEDKREVYVG